MAMYNVHTFFSRLWQSPIPRRAAVLLVALAWSSFAVGGETNDLAQSRYVKQAKASLERNPGWAFSKDTAGLTPLHRAALRGHKDVAEFLLAHKADVNAKDDFGATPLLCAALRGYTDVVELLLANKAEVNAKDKNGLTPLHCAAMDGHKDMVELLLTNKAEVNAKNNEGQTPLQIAAHHKSKDVVELLRQHGGHE
jgi:ankyrin repeat protein